MQQSHCHWTQITSLYQQTINNSLPYNITQAHNSASYINWATKPTNKTYLTVQEKFCVPLQLDAEHVLHY